MPVRDWHFYLGCHFELPTESIKAIALHITGFRGVSKGVDVIVDECRTN